MFEIFRSCRLSHTLALALLVTCFSPRELVSSEGKRSGIVLGRVENVVLEDAALKLKARIDTGAGVSSVHAEILDVFRADATGVFRDRIVFRLSDTSGRVVRLERDVLEWMRVKRKGVSGFIDRPVVLMDFCLGGKQIEARVNLANRSRFIYPLLIGRNVLKAGGFLIDPSKTFMEHPGCDWRTKIGRMSTNSTNLPKAKISGILPY